MKISNIEVTYLGGYGSDITVVNAARVSFHKESKMVWDDLLQRDNLEPPDAKLIQYLAKHKHFSPFNHSFLSFRIKAPLFCARQFVKHKFMPWNEVSRRYVEEEPEFYFPNTWRKKADNVKQGSSEEEVILEDIFPEDTCSIALINYNALMSRGVCPEQARMILPQNMMTEWIWSGTLGAFLDMLVLRLDPHTQKESRDVANLIAEEVKKYFPVSFNARINQ
jgi:thymidylate synthase (FAD)